MADTTQFFKEIDPGKDLDEFTAHMKTPVEEIPILEPDGDDDLSPIGEPGSDGDGEPDPNEQHFNYTSAHKLSAELGLRAVDRFTSNLASLLSNKPATYYREKISTDDHANDVNITAALIKKYEFSVSIEVWFVIAMVARYSVMVTEGVKQAKQPVQEENKENGQPKTKPE